MKIKIIKKKASSLKELTSEEIEIPHVRTLKELLIAISMVEYHKQYTKKEILPMTEEKIRQYAKLGKVTFELYNDQQVSFNKAIETMLQDFEDGLFRVYIQQEQYTSLDQIIPIKEPIEVVFIRLMMMAGRLW